MKNINWYYNRLRAMSPAEIPYRFIQLSKKHYGRWKYSENTSVLELDSNIKLSKQGITETNKRLENLYYKDFFGGISKQENMKMFNENISIFKEIDWHQGSEGSQWDFKSFSVDIPFRNSDKGEIRYTWEINRHLFFPRLAALYKQTSQEEYLKILKSHFYDWIDKNPFCKGVNWSSPMEISIRAYQWILTYSILKEENSKFTEDLLKGSINSINYVMQNLSKYSSANNHLILEVAIGSIIGFILEPVYKQDWFQKGYNILEKEIPKQIYSDGVNKEQAVHYHAFVLDMLIQYNIVLQKKGDSPLHKETLYKMTKFLGCLSQSGSVPEIGDSDDAKIVCFGGYTNYYQYLLQLASFYFKKQFIVLEKIYPEIEFLLGDIQNINLEYIEYEELCLFEKGGYSVINSKDTFFVFDTGPLGFGGLAAHGHADALNIIYNYKNKPILVEPGTYIYNIEPEWRDYFRRTDVHNTLSVSGENQSEMQGPFLWGKKANAILEDVEKFENGFLLKGKHDGYDSSIHHRAVCYLKKYELLIIADRFDKKADINYTFDPLVQIKQNTSNSLIINDELYLNTTSDLQIIEKYVSHKFMEKTKSSGLLINHDFINNPVHYTIISPYLFEVNDKCIVINNEEINLLKLLGE
ncbi:hypothetical protein COI41_26190 [Bacillus toyonensis]|uniref:alginate lyase family protein n=1 Tax=Bacillus toyonensis TaxID=155322 RepID=UPI000BFC9EE2|nr:alginate lyase family protein [Bacillus toyonensis]PHF50621.1 hypothetical protein COI41_26190 [Bacillus toyonensis]